MTRRTKIVATLGPSTQTSEQLIPLIKAGINVARFNFSHGTKEEHIQRAILIRSLSEKLGKNVAILGDLQGPKIRIGRFTTGNIHLKNGQQFILDTTLDLNQGDQHQVGILYKQLVVDCKLNDTFLLDDGKISLRVKKIEKLRIITTVTSGGELSDHKGINLLGGGLSASVLTEKDKQDIQLAATIGVDFLAVSFVRCAQDIEKTRQLLIEAGSHAAVVAKIERAEVIKDESILKSIIQASDAVMVARGDLGVEIGDAELIGVQKNIIQKARRLNKPVITATQMMESMIFATHPTRAEVFDVANAVLDGTDAVMLSAETATGEYPEKVVSAMARICVGAEKNADLITPFDPSNSALFDTTDEAIALTATYVANRLGAKAIICLTKSGSTPLWVSRMNTQLPILALTRYDNTKRRVALYRGVKAVSFDSGSTYGTEVSNRAINQLKMFGLLSSGDVIILTKGEIEEIEGGTNTMQILTVP